MMWHVSIAKSRTLKWCAPTVQASHRYVYRTPEHTGASEETGIPYATIIMHVNNTELLNIVINKYGQTGEVIPYKDIKLWQNIAV